jgi:hypothetical protein
VSRRVLGVLVLGACTALAGVSSPRAEPTAAGGTEPALRAGDRLDGSTAHLAKGMRPPAR